MNSYPLLALGLISGVFIVDLIAKTGILRQLKTWYILIIFSMFTLIFNGILTSLPIVTYDPTKLAGFFIGTIPLEDFSYAFVAVILPRIITTLYEHR